MKISLLLFSKNYLSRLLYHPFDGKNKENVNAVTLYCVFQKKVYNFVQVLFNFKTRYMNKLCFNNALIEKALT